MNGKKRLTIKHVPVVRPTTPELPPRTFQKPTGPAYILRSPQPQPTCCCGMPQVVPQAGYGTYGYHNVSTPYAHTAHHHCQEPQLFYFPNMPPQVYFPPPQTAVKPVLKPKAAAPVVSPTAPVRVEKGTEPMKEEPRPPTRAERRAERKAVKAAMKAEKLAAKTQRAM